MSLPSEIMPVGLLGTGAVAAEGYAIERSVRFNSADSAYLSKTFASTGNRKTWTWAGWVKRGALGVVQQIFASRPTVSPYSLFYFFTDNKLAFDNGISSFSTNAVFRDSSAWYHIVFWWDSTQATGANRIKLYVNGVEQTFASASYPTQNADGQINTATNHTIGKGGNYTNEHFNGYLADVHFIDGQALDPTSFGEFDDNGIWQPIEYTGNYGFVSVADATGALPIYNTTDTLGTVKGTGTRTDSNSSSIVLAVPMDGANNGTTFTDESATIKGSGSAKGITRNGDTKTSTAQSKYYGSSGYFDGTGDTLTLAASSDFAFGTNDFTIETWIYSEDISGSTQKGFFQLSDSSGGLNTNLNTGVAIYFGSGGYLTVKTGGITVISSLALSQNTWYHIAVTRSGDVHRLFVDGIERGTVTSSRSDITQQNVVVGGIYSTGYLYQGYLNDFRVYKGVAKYTSNFTIVTTNNSFHLPFDDNSTAAALGTDTSGAGNDWAVNNLFTRSVTTLPAVAFDGSGDYLSLADSDDWNFGGGDFTVEAFIYPRSFANEAIIAGQWSGDLGGTGLNWALMLDGSNNGYLRLLTSSSGSSVLFDLSTSTYSLTLNKWSHIAAVRNGNTFTLYIDGVSRASTTNSSSLYNATNVFTIGSESNSIVQYFNGFISNLRIVKGTALYTSGFTIPSAPLANVTNTKLLCCQSSTSATAATVSPGTITANGNVFATTRSDSSSSEDSLVDVPQNGTETDTGLGNQVRGNYATLNPLDNGGLTLSNGNLQFDRAANAWFSCRSTIAVTSGKWYWEVSLTTGVQCMVGIAKATATIGSYFSQSSEGWGYNAADGLKYNNNVTQAYGNTWTAGDTIGIAFDADTGELRFYKNGTVQNSGTAAYTGLTSGPYFAAIGLYGTTTAHINFGQRPFAYTAPSGFKALNTANLGDPVVTKPSEYFDVVTYTGSSSPITISGLAFSPDLVWSKNRSTSNRHGLIDSVRGVNLSLASNLTNAELLSQTDLLTSFTSDGYTIGVDAGQYGWNWNGQSFVNWAWDAGSSTVTNTDGSITSQVRANPSAGFSIVTYTGSSSNFTVGHGLGVEPRLIFIKNRSNAANWFVITKATGSWIYGHLNATNGLVNAVQSANSSTINLANAAYNWFNANGNNFVAYCFAPVESYSAFGRYTGNGSSADGPFVFTNHRPRWILLKRTDTTSNWTIIDTTREGYNVDNDPLYPNLTDAEGTTDLADILSNGFKLRSADASVNATAGTYIYASFAEQPFQYSRAR